jgi:hypothetical protein
MRFMHKTYQRNAAHKPHMHSLTGRLTVQPQQHIQATDSGVSEVSVCYCPGCCCRFLSHLMYQPPLSSQQLQPLKSGRLAFLTAL